MFIKDNLYLKRKYKLSFNEKKKPLIFNAFFYIKKGVKIQMKLNCV